MVGSWCEVVIRSFAMTFQQGCSLCWGRDDRENIYRFYDYYIRPLNQRSSDPLTVTIDDCGDLYVRSQPLPLRKRLVVRRDNCYRFASNVVTFFERPVEYSMYVEYDGDASAFEEMKERDSRCRFKISEHSNVRLDVVEVSGEQYLRLWLHFAWEPLIHKVINSFHAILPERWFK